MKKIITLTGCSASGKDTLLNMIIWYNKNILPIISTTTRPMRKGEKEGINYYFKKEIDLNNLIEYRKYQTINGTYFYGIEKEEIENKLKQNDTLIVILDYRGLKAMREYCLKNNIKIESYYIQVPLKTRLYRSLKREEWEYPDDEHYLEICRRAIADNEEVEIAKYDKEIKVINNETNVDFLKNILNISESVEIQ